MSEQITGGEVIARTLRAHGVTAAFGVISIHNTPILDAFDRLGAIRFYEARSESGATNMADAYARVHGGLGVVVTSTGPGAGNACGGLTEAMAACTPLIHLTGNIDSADVDHDRGMNHETLGQLDMLKAVSKAAFRVRSAQALVSTLCRAIEIALTVPRGPVSIEIPIDIQAKLTKMPANVPVIEPPALAATDVGALEALVNAAREAKRPMLWIGDGAREARSEIARLMKLGFGVVTSIHGRAIVDESDPMSLATLNNLDPTQAFFETCDLMIVVGSRLRGTETRIHKLKLPHPLIQVDVDIAAMNRNYEADLFVRGSSQAVLKALADRLEGGREASPQFSQDLLKAKHDGMELMRKQCGPYALISDALRAVMPRDAVFVRDVTISANTWAHRVLQLPADAGTVHALGGGIGQGLQHAIGAKAAAGAREVYALCGDGGLALNMGELATAVQEKTDMTIVLMNDGGYGVIRNICDAAYGRQFFSELLAPGWQDLCGTLGIRSWHVKDVNSFREALDASSSTAGVRLIEVDMKAVGPFPIAFAGPRAK